MKSATEQRLEREVEVTQRTELIRKARGGDEVARRTLSEPPYKLRVYTDREIEAVEHRRKKP